MESGDQRARVTEMLAEALEQQGDLASSVLLRKLGINAIQVSRKASCGLPGVIDALEAIVRVDDDDQSGVFPGKVYLDDTSTKDALFEAASGSPVLDPRIESGACGGSSAGADG